MSNDEAVLLSELIRSLAGKCGVTDVALHAAVLERMGEPCQERAPFRLLQELDVRLAQVQ